MNVSIRKISDQSAERVVIECVEMTKDVEDIRDYARSKGITLSGILNKRIYNLELSSIFYFEAVDEKLFAYTIDNVYEVKARLYEIENAYLDKHFMRCAKSFVINMMLIDSISPALNGRFMAHMKNGENIMISRQYVSIFKKAVLGGK